ncbi:MAG: enoyl-CoA hydratase-related protein [Actinomycetota bacterium]
MIRRERDGNVEVVRLDAPPLHLLGSAMITALRKRFVALQGDPPRSVVLHCTGGGADVRELAALDATTGRSFITALHDACRAIRALDAPVIAAVDGPCMGAHLEVAAACDMRVASERSQFAMPEILVGIPSVIDAWWILRICGIGAASSLFFDGRPIDAAEALRIGLVNRVEPDEALNAAALAWAARIAGSSPIALAEQKRVLRDWTQAEYERAASASVERLVAAIQGGEAGEAMRAMLEKRHPSFE